MYPAKVLCPVCESAMDVNWSHHVVMECSPAELGGFRQELQDGFIQCGYDLVGTNPQWELRFEDITLERVDIQVV